MGIERMTPAGIMLRTKRIEKQEYLRDTADLIGVSSSHFSKLEFGLERFTKPMIDVLTKEYELNNDEKMLLLKQYKGNLQDLKKLMEEMG